MGKQALRLLSAAALGLAIMLGGLIVDSPAPNHFNPAAWGGIVAVTKYVIDYLISLRGPAPATPTSASKSGY